MQMVIRAAVMRVKHAVVRATSPGESATHGTSPFGGGPLTSKARNTLFSPCSAAPAPRILRGMRFDQKSP